VTEQRDRVITDPGIGPVENPSTLRSIVAAAEEVEPDGAALYYEPKPLIAISDHKTLEIATVKLSEDIDPRKLPTELRLPRSPIPPQYDSGWPQAQIALSASQPPAAPQRRWRIPAVLLTLLCALLLLVLARGLSQHESSQAAAPAVDQVVGAQLGAIAAVPETAADPLLVSAPAAPRAAPPVIVFGPSAAAASASSGVSGAHPLSESAAAADHASNLLHHSAPSASPHPSASGSALSAPTFTKPKRAIY